MSKSRVYRETESIEDQKEFDWGALQWFASGSIGNAEGLTLGRARIEASNSNPRHCHPTCEEALYLLSGRIVHTLGDEEFTLEAGDTICIPAGIFHNATNIGSERADMIIAYSSATRDFVLE